MHLDSASTHVHQASISSKVPVLQVVGYKNSGKTTFTCKLIAALSARGVRMGSAKHDAHTFELDEAGTDSSNHLLSGSVETVLTSQTATRIMRPSETSLDEIAEQMYGRVDLLLAEGFKTAVYPKIALLRDQDDLKSLLTHTSNIKLLVSWQSSITEEAYNLQLESYGYPRIPILYIHNEAFVMEEAISLALSLL